MRFTGKTSLLPRFRYRESPRAAVLPRFRTVLRMLLIPTQVGRPHEAGLAPVAEALLYLGIVNLPSCLGNQLLWEVAERGKPCSIGRD